jgi:hypothetical protein
MRVGRPPTLPDFELVEHPGAQVWAKPQATAWVRYVLESGQTLHEAAGQDREAFRMEGRGPVFVIPAKIPREADGNVPGRWAVRHYARGGRVVSRALGDRYLRWGRIRPFHESEASKAVRKRGIPTPLVVAAAVYPSGPFYRGDLVTDFIPGSSDLVEALFDSRRKGLGGAVERQDALRTAGELIRRMAENGIQHKDIHAGNILLEWQGAAPRPHLLDLDRCEVAPAGSSVSPDPMLRRLQRSLGRWESQTGLRISDKEWETLEAAVMG